MRTVLLVVALAALASSANAYIHVPPQTLKKLCAESPQIRALTVKARNGDKGAIVLDVEETLRAKEKAAIASFKLVIRPDADGGKAILDKLAVGKSVVFFTQEHGKGKQAKGFGYAFTDEAAFSVDYNAEGEYWLLVRAEPGLSVAYHGAAAKLPAFVKALLAGKEVKVPTKAPAKADDYSLRGLLVEEARRRNSPSYPKAPLPTAWGKPAKGLQAGVRINPVVEIPGAVLVMEVVVRNTGTKGVTFTHLQLAFAGAGADGAATGKGEEYSSRFMPKGSRMATYVSPGDAYAVAAVPLFRPAEGKDWKLPRLRLQPGKTSVGLEGVGVRLGSGKKGEDVDLSTGYLDVELPAPKK